MHDAPLAAAAVALAFVDCINRRDLDGLTALMSADHRLEVFDEDPLVGRNANVDAWRGYFGAFPEYLIYAREISERDGVVAILGNHDYDYDPTRGAHSFCSSRSSCRHAPARGAAVICGWTPE